MGERTNFTQHDQAQMAIDELKGSTVGQLMEEKRFGRVQIPEKALRKMTILGTMQLFTTFVPLEIVPMSMEHEGEKLNYLEVHCVSTKFKVHDTDELPPIYGLQVADFGVEDDVT